jgi:hypothetical protein
MIDAIIIGAIVGAVIGVWLASRATREKCTNFQPVEGRSNTATIDYTTWRPFKRTVVRHVTKRNAFWRFIDTGEFTPGDQVENLAFVYEVSQ